MQWQLLSSVMNSGTGFLCDFRDIKSEFEAI
ncbi:hypothetical protein Xmau_03897 [Xenorhabdus mauleonii]|uniref:Uncharacterized protein n=1 Tax=Xenorhabdus mauleonii TaxID=351675 RepID=A0A1I3VN71_9GAMM|nr:hypothetical protein Xmau_03897 [Xenorhabdus mauleonii]SFJ95756.1 hypothetical protein SAMN05421680_12144 [Xenorhabdus mauleonii]